MTIFAPDVPETAVASAPAPCRSVLVPLDGSEAAVAAVPVARALAELHGATLHFVHVGGPEMPLRRLIPEMGLKPGELSGCVLDALAGAPAERILELARSCEGPMVVMGARSLLGAAGALGPVASDVLARARFPVVIVRPERAAAPFAVRRILVPHDGTERTASGLGPAVRLAERAGASVLVLHVAPPPGEAFPSAARLPQYIDQPQHEWPEWARGFLERLEIFAGVVTAPSSPQVFLVRGEPAAEIVRFAARREVDLVALAWSGAVGLERAATLREVVAGTSCPLLILREAF